jgi:L-seryl-tRNA(Ser) seleniumtransferase
MLTEARAAIKRRARGLLRRLPPETHARLGLALVDTTSQVGGGALPTVELPTAAVALGTRERPAQALDERLRTGQPPVLGRVLDDRLLLDFRTILPPDIPALARALSSL